MNIIKLKHPLTKEKIENDDILLILGYFDGVHLAHQQVIKKGVQIAKQKNLKVALMTFNRNPSIVYHKIKHNMYTNLTQPVQKYCKIKNLGVDILYEIHFNSEFGNLSPSEFVDQYIVGLNAKVVVAGFDYTYGKPEIASMKQLPTYAKNRFEIIQISEAIQNGETISSTFIREQIKNGKVKNANRMLGYNYETLGFVVRGEARGRELGFPTANVYSKPYTLLPKPGVYTVYFTVKGKRYGGMASIGYNVTFTNDKNLTVEVNIFDFNDEIYGDEVKIEWLTYLRDEIKFSNSNELIEQLKKDEEDSKKILNTQKNKKNKK